MYALKKLFKAERDDQKGYVMLVITLDTSRGYWPLGRMLNRKGDHARVAKLQVGQGTLTWPLTKLCPLYMEKIECIVWDPMNCIDSYETGLLQRFLFRWSWLHLNREEL